MISIMLCVRRRSDISLQEFRRYWKEDHARLVQMRASALSIRRYVQWHTAPGRITDSIRQQRGAADAFDGIAQVEFDDVAALLASGRTPEGAAAAAALVEDEARFIDLRRSSIFLAEEHEVIAFQSRATRP